MPRYGATEDENRQFPSREGQGPSGLGVGVSVAKPTHPGAARLVSLSATPPRRGFPREHGRCVLSS